MQLLQTAMPRAALLPSTHLILRWSGESNVGFPFTTVTFISTEGSTKKQWYTSAGRGRRGARNGA